MSDTETHSSRYVDADALARILDVNPETVRRQYRLRRLPGVKVGRKLRFDVAQVEAALNKAEEPKTTPATRSEKRLTARPNFAAIAIETQGETMHQDIIRITPNTKKCANCGDVFNLEAGKRGRKPRFCSTTCKNKMQTEIRHLRNAARNNRSVSQRDGMAALADLADRQEARAELLANPRSTWEQING